MFSGTIMMICGGGGLLGCLVWIAADSAGRSRRAQKYTEQALQSVRAVPFTSGTRPHTTAAVTQPTTPARADTAGGAQGGTAPLMGGGPCSTGFCAACGTPLSAGAAFCRNCGKPVR